MSNPTKGEKVMFTHAGEPDVPDQNQFVVVLRKRHLEVLRRVPLQPREHLLIHAGHTAGSIKQAGPIRVLPNRSQDCSHGTFDRLKIYVAVLDRPVWPQSGVRVTVDSVKPNAFDAVDHD